MRKTFDLITKFGTVYFIVNGANEIYVSDHKRVDYKDTYSDILIRNKFHNNLHLRFGMRGGLEFDGRTYGYDGNTVIFVSDAPNEYFKVRAVHMSEGNRNSFSIKDSSDSAKSAIYDEIKLKLNAFYLEHRGEMDAEFAARKQENKEAKINELKEKVAALEKELSETKEELARVDKQLDSFREV